ncbi:MAG: sigma-70 family RNA polymerase sigma factor, partial [Clostridia bacterium]|nr:sigma-70 family RNA polymerase sigma factor [Clostridia bacterium]
RDNTPVKMPRSLKEMQQKIRYARQKLSIKLSGEPTAQDISRETGIPLEDVLYAIESMAFPRSLDEPMFDEAGSTVMDTLEDSRNSFSKLSDKLALRQCLDQLDERERKVILLRYFKNLTQSNIADMMGISQVQISRIESRVLEKLRKKLG